MKSQIVIAALLSALSVPAFAGHAAAQAAKEMVPSRGLARVRTALVV